MMPFWSNLRRRDRWLAFGATFAFMCLWIFTPIGVWIEAAVYRIHPDAVGWPMIVIGLALFWTVYGLLGLRRRRPSPLAGEGGGRRPTDEGSLRNTNRDDG